MKKGLTLLAMLGLILVAGCTTNEDLTLVVSPAELKPPLGLKAYAGDGQITAKFISGNAEDELFGFAIFMAEGDLSSGKVPGSMFDDADIASFDTYGDGVATASDPEVEDSGNPVQPVAAILATEGEEGPEAVALAIGADAAIPGPVSMIIKNGDTLPVVGAAAEGDDDDDAAADDDDAAADDDDDAARFPMYASDTTGDDDDDAAPAGSVAVTNGQKYTLFAVSIRSDWAISWTSNYAVVVPRPESGELTITKGCSTATDGIDLSEFSLVNFAGCSDSVYNDASGADLILEAFDASGMYGTGLAGVNAYFSAANGGLVQDLGFAEDWANMMAAPIDEASYITAGISILAADGHVYAVKTGDGNFAKVWVKAVAEDKSSVTVIVAYQTAVDEPLFK